ncbi:hypothetical protein RHSIM_Rhsim04G0144000 [Rhododendron simsii]|uniref:Uncharacterized protein n=1 Tax=Rhododendron simsii TaxID=118357 RepID=A0A834H810_RHOSS|nr:hypothetical protein RHSIM_Rhsim04G0144000 [Rhododendron simsii]
MAMANAFASLSLNNIPCTLLLSSSLLLIPTSSVITSCKIPSAGSSFPLGRTARAFFFPTLALKNRIHCEAHVDRAQNEEEEEEEEEVEPNETLLYSFTPLPLLFVAALPGVITRLNIRIAAGTVKSLFGPFVELVKSFNLPSWLVHWGHPGNMAVVLFAMGGYGTYLGFRIRFSDDVEEKATAKDLHPKLLAGMFFFFALGATGGVTSLLTSDKPIFESPHAVTGSIGLALLTIQTILPTLFEELEYFLSRLIFGFELPNPMQGNPGLRNVHGILGSGIMTLFLVHAALGLQLGFSY